MKNSKDNENFQNQSDYAARLDTAADRILAKKSRFSYFNSLNTLEKEEGPTDFNCLMARLVDAIEELTSKVEDLSENVGGVGTEIYKYRRDLDQNSKNPSTKIWM